MVAPTRILRTSWPSTLRLPKSSFPPRPLPESSAEYLRRCTDDLYSWQQDSRQSSETFTLHDGPPYANGPLHIGHALNKITKDIICRYQVSQGKKVSFIPGWDCHGLPIEIKALQAQKKDLASTHPVSVREAARQLAADTIESQKAGFKEWAVMGDWAHAYKTMDKEFEIRQLEVFKKMFEKGLIYRQYKPVYWSPSSRTALAEAELEYDENYKSLAAYVRYPVQMAEELRSGLLNVIQEPLSVIIWTTTPWTLPANRAIAVHNDMGYCVIRYDMDGSEYAIIAASRAEEFQKTLNRPVEVVLSGIRGSSLAEKLWYQNPFQKGRGLQKIIHADFVTDSSGTGLVHMAPGHGMDDYHVCSALGIEAFAPVDDAGTFTKDAFPDHPELLEGLPVTDIKKSGSTAVLNYLGSLGFVLAKHNYRHKYPIDWRTKEPVITRATAQWFANAESIKKDAMNAIEEVEFLPETGRSRLESFIQGRSQWCISRQRAWGVPIPALYKAQEDGQLEAVMDSQTIEHIVNVIKERGIDAWWTDAPDDPAWTPKHLDGSHLRGKDTMDVWFDSGTSWTLLPAKPDEPVADVYLEGTDQHRGWFQSSLLTHVSTLSSDTHKIKAPYKTLITHGFTLDSKGRKMSKSLGNVIAPSQIMSGELLPPIKRKKQKGVEQEQPKKAGPTYDAMGSDALRLWAASSNYTQDVTVGQPMLMTINQALHKYRVTFKWLLGVLSLPTCPPVFTSFNGLRTTLAGTSDGNAKASNISNLADRLAFHRLTQVSHEVHHHYSKYEFHKGVGVINKYIANDLSAFYFETLKDRIYTGHQRDCEELQRILGLIFYELLHMIGPICPLLVEEVWDHTPAALQKDSTHPARAIWTPLPRPSPLEAKHLTATQALVNKLNTSIKAAQERLRAEKKLGSSLESSVVLFVRHNAADNTNNPSSLPSSSSSSTDWFQSHFGSDEDLAGLFVVSAFAKETYHTPASKHDHAAWKAATQPPSQWWDEEPLDPKDVGEGHSVLVFQARGTKCPRCWKFTKPPADELCERCDGVVRGGGK